MPLLSTLLAGCQLLQPAPPPPPEEPACSLSSDTLADRRFVREQRNKTNNGDEPDLWARMSFFKAGDTLKVRYNSRSPFDMYTYTCAKEKSGFKCLQDVAGDKEKLKQWCQTLWANKGTCSPAELADLTGASVADATAAQSEIMAAIAKLKDSEKANMKIAFSQPNNQLRGQVKVKVNTEACKLAVTDTYQTMTEGQIRDLETYVGNSRFIEYTEPLPFAHCDVKNLVALSAPGAAAQPGQHKLDWNAGDTVPFAAVDPERAKPDAACSYAMDFWADFRPMATGQAVTAGPDGKLAWSASHAFADRGNHVVQMTRWKTCGGEPERLDDLCALVKVAGGE